MKKTYITPSVKVSEVEIENIICQSIDVQDEYGNGLTVGSRRDRFEDEWEEN